MIVLQLVAQCLGLDSSHDEGRILTFEQVGFLLYCSSGSPNPSPNKPFLESEDAKWNCAGACSYHRIRPPQSRSTGTK